MNALNTSRAYPKPNKIVTRLYRAVDENQSRSLQLGFRRTDLTCPAAAASIFSNHISPPT